MDKVAFLRQECENASRHFARYTVFFHLHLALNFIGGAMQSQMADKSDNDDHSRETDDS